MRQWREDEENEKMQRRRRREEKEDDHERWGVERRGGHGSGKGVSTELMGNE
jgi:hypothetical protein